MLRLVVLLLLLAGDAAGVSMQSIATSRLRFTQPPSRQPATSKTLTLSTAGRRPPTRTQAETSSAMPLVTLGANQTLEVEAAALRALANLPAPICVMAMAGTARDGKSSFLNMFAQWLRARWGAAGAAGGDFEVGHDYDTCTSGAWLRLLTSQDGEPFPGTQCSSIALIDTQGIARGASLGVQRLFSLALLSASTMTLNVMRQFNDDTLERLGDATAHAKAQLPEGSAASDAPNLVVVLRDSRLGFKQGGRPVTADAMLHAALQPAEDALDATRRAVRTFFTNHTMLPLRQPDEADLSAMAERGAPKAGRPFYTSFAAAASKLVASLRPKLVGGALLTGDVLAATVSSLAEQINTESPHLSLRATVDVLHHSQASTAVAAGRAAFRERLPPLGLGGPANGAGSDVRLRGAALSLTPATLELQLRNATEAAVQAFALHAPNMGTGARIQPYLEQLRSSVHAMERELRQAHEHASRVAALHASKARLAQENVAQRAAIDALLAQQQQSRAVRLQDLLGNVAIVALGASTALLPPVLLTRMAPLVRGAPIALSMLGVWRVAQRSMTHVASAAVRKVRSLLPGTLGQPADEPANEPAAAQQPEPQPAAA